jgi:hypothetical protein
LLLTPIAARAQVSLTSNVTFNAGLSLFTYTYSVTNNLPVLPPDPLDPLTVPNTLAFVDLSVPALAGAVLLNPATFPTGFQIVFDPGLGLVSFLEDLEDPLAPTPQSFAPQTTVGGFTFNSPFGPQGTSFMATVLPNGNTISGTTLGPSVIPEPGTLTLLAVGITGALLLPGGEKPAVASSHSDAPLIKLDPQANLTDVYAFIRNRPNGQKVLVVEVSVRPFSEPGDGPMYDVFSDDARYSIHLTNPATGAETARYDFRFSPVGVNGNYKNLDTILRYGRGTEVGPIQTVGDARQNFVQSYTLTKVVGNTATAIGTNLLVPPYNAGVRTTPKYNDPATGKAVSGATNRAGLDDYTRQTTYDLTSGGITYTSFAGSREDGFYADVPGIFDLLDPRILLPSPTGTFGQAGNGVDGFKGFNVLHYGIVIPVTDLQASQFTGIAFDPSATASSGVITSTQTGVGVYASVSRPRVTLRSTVAEAAQSGPFIQVNRLANPLFNEVLVALRDKDRYNRTSPTEDASFAKYALNPEVAVLINTVYNTTFQTTGRGDLALVYLPDVIRVETTTPPARVSGDPNPTPGGTFNRLSILGGDVLVNSAGNNVPGGWPNGRRFGDDVVDIALSVVASGPTFSMLTPVGDNVAANDQVYNAVFPYAATPHAGSRHSKDSGINQMP